MKKHIPFSRGLYREGLRRLRIPGIIFFVILTLEAIFIPLTRVTSINRRFAWGAVEAESITAIGAHPLLFLTFTVMAPILAWTIFSWMNHRNSSDLYHALPHRRISLYTSQFAALITWLAALIFVSGSISRLMLAIFGRYFEITGGGYTPYMLGCFAASVLTAGAVTIGISLTGTLLNNIIVSGLIIYLPRFVIQLVVSSVTYRLDMVPKQYLPSVLSAGINIVTSPISFFLGAESSSIFSAKSCIYTAAVALLYVIIGGICFCRRRSESAERSAPSTFLQSVYRIAVAMVICVPVCCMIFMNRGTDTYDLLLYVIFYTAALIAYFSYELITTKKWKNLIRTLPGLGAVVILNILLYASMYGLYSTQLNFTPAPEEIKSVSIMQSDSYSSPAYQVSGIIEEEVSQLRITDPEALRAVSDALRETVEHYRAAESTAYPYVPYEDALDFNMRSSITVCIRSGFIDKYRTIRVSRSQLNTIFSALRHTDGYSSNGISLPKPANGSTIEFNDANNDFTAAEMLHLFETMESELKKADISTWYDYINIHRDDDNCYIDSLSYRTADGDGSRWIRVPFNSTLLPETTNEYLKLISPGDADPSTDEILGADGNDAFGYFSISLYVPSKPGGTAQYAGMIPMTDEAIAAAIEAIADGTANISKPFIIVRRSLDVYETVAADDTSKPYAHTVDRVYALPVTSDGAETLSALAEK